MAVNVVALNHGVPAPAKIGEWIRKATIRSLTGLDEQVLLDLPASIPTYSKAVMLLERITTFEGTEEAGIVLKKMTLGDRVCLLLNVRKLMKGDIISCTIDCPKCKRSMSADISINELLKTKCPEPENDNYELIDGGFSLRIRPLTAEDQNLFLSKILVDESLKQNLARACIVQSKPNLPAILSEGLLEVIGSRLGEVDPLSDISLNLLCPECNHTFQASFDAEEYILGEIASNSYRDLEREVHWIAFHYHWSEKEILSIPTTKRKRYVELVNTTLSGEAI